jgi:hypothetical protein
MTVNDIIFSIIFIGIYYVYITINDESFYSIYKDLLDGYIDEKNGRSTSIRYFLIKDA